MVMQKELLLLYKDILQINKIHFIIELSRKGVFFMNSNRIFIGDIYCLTRFQIEESCGAYFLQPKKINQSKNNVLIKLKEDEYVRIEDFHYYFALRKIFPELMQNKILKPYNPETATEGLEYVDPLNMKSYISSPTNVSLRIAKKRQVRK